LKPHFGCTDATGRDNVRSYIAGLVSNHTGLISLLEFEFPLEQPDGYTAFGGNCKSKYSDPAVVLVDESQFSIVSGVGKTLVGNYSEMPFLTGNKPDVGPMCVSNATETGERPYAGAVLLHKASGKEICVVTATFPHCMHKWEDHFIADVNLTCGSRQLLVIADTNAGCESRGSQDSYRYSMSRIFAHHGVDFGPCHDPGQFADPTCCNDTSQTDIATPRYAYDRTAVCRGGFVDQFQVAPEYFCGADEEHRFTSARVWLADHESAYCLDHSGCASLDPLDGLCCPVADGTRLACCDDISDSFAVDSGVWPDVIL